MRAVTTLAVAGMVALLTSTAQATTINGAETADNYFSTYLSTNDNVLGTLVDSGNNWPSTYTFSSLLTPGVTNYLHVVPGNGGGPKGYIGSFTLSDALFQFANGTQSIYTDTTNWKASGSDGSAWFLPTGTPQSFAVNGASPWGSFAGINSNANWIWSNPTGVGDIAFISTPINFIRQPSTDVPEPSTLLLLGSGLAGPFLRRRREPKA